jgi:GTPase KRas protein
LLVYDITNIKSFEKIKNYYVNELREKSKNIFKCILLGNKTDLEENRKVSQEEGLALAKENQFVFMETSCVTNCNVSSAFETLIEMTNTEMKKNNCQRLKTKNDYKGNNSTCCLNI